MWVIDAVVWQRGYFQMRSCILMGLKTYSCPCRDGEEGCWSMAGKPNPTRAGGEGLKYCWLLVSRSGVVRDTKNLIITGNFDHFVRAILLIIILLVPSTYSVSNTVSQSNRQHRTVHAPIGPTSSSPFVTARKWLQNAKATRKRQCKRPPAAARRSC